LTGRVRSAILEASPDKWNVPRRTPAFAALNRILARSVVRTKFSLALALAAFSGLVADAGSQDRPTFKASVDLVPISAVVRDGHNRLVMTLNVDDFQVLDNGTRCKILDFHRDQTSPMTVALLVDVSGSMKIGPKLAFAKSVLDQMTVELTDGRDEAGLFTFDSALRVQQPFTVHHGSIGSHFDEVEPFGTTSLYDAIAETARILAQRPSQRRAVIVFTDGVDTSSDLTPAEVSGLASSIDVPVYIVVTVPPIDADKQLAHPTEPLPRQADLRDLAQWTGGDLLIATSAEEAGLKAHQIAGELRHQYLLAVEASDRFEWRRLDVRVRDRKFTVRARNGYFGREASTSK
jgi:Ca-activated chloride channel homolog